MEGTGATGNNGWRLDKGEITHRVGALETHSGKVDEALMRLVILTEKHEAKLALLQWLQGGTMIAAVAGAIKIIFFGGTP